MRLCLCHQLDNIGRVLSAFLFLRLSFLSEILPLFADEQDSFGIDGCGFLLKVRTRENFFGSDFEFFTIFAFNMFKY